IEPSLSLHNDPYLPAAFAVRFRAALIYEHRTAQCHVVSEADPSSTVASHLCFLRNSQEKSEAGGSNLATLTPDPTAML
ncbi:MAG: hypothetical protein AAF483_17475, partial [Planctomycetota bacterium]